VYWGARNPVADLQRIADDGIPAFLSWRAPDGRSLLPYHPYTKAAQAPVPIGKVVRYGVEVSPTFDTLQPGHRLRVTIATSEFPHALPTLTQGAGLIGGVYQVEHTTAYPSSVELPLIAGPVALSSR
jgi:predicted acyl esterase